MTTLLYGNFDTYSELAAPLASATALTTGTMSLITGGAARLGTLPTEILIDSEILTADSISSGDVVNVTRGVAGTVGAHATSTIVEVIAGPTLPNRLRELLVAHVHNSADGTQYIAHSALTGLTTGDPHTQYAEIANSETVSGTWTVSGKVKASGITGMILPQVAAGVPSHTADEGTLYWDSTNNKLYVNNNGSTAWTLAGPGTVGTVTSVAMTVPSILSVAGTPITSSGTLAVTLATQLANLVFAGPSSGGAVAPTFRSLVANDLPTITQAAVALGATTPTSTASATYVTMADMSCTLTTTGGPLIAILVTSHLNTGGAGNTETFAVALDGAAEVGDMTAFGQQNVTTVVYYWAAPSAASHTVLGRYKTSAGTASLNGTQRILLLLELKK